MGDQKIADSHVKFYADPYGDLTKNLGMEMTHPGPYGKGLVGRCKRFALYIDNGVVKHLGLAEDYDFDPAGDEFPEKTLPPADAGGHQEGPGVRINESGPWI